MKKYEEKVLIFSTLTSVLLSLALVITTVSFVVLKLKHKKEYSEKWKDYDGCGV